MMLQAIIVDDEPGTRKTIQKIGLWKENGIVVVAEAENGLDALRLIKQMHIDIAFIDMKMPGLSGPELLLELSKNQLFLTVVVISGYDDFNYALAAVKYGVMDYLLKPIDRTELNKVLSKISQKNQSKSNDSSFQREEKYDILVQIRKRINTDYTTEISLSSISSEYFLGKETLSRAFKKRFGIGITALITKLRLEKAQELLLAGYNCNEVSEIIGYRDSNYFSRVFKTTFGCPPSEYKSFQNKSNKTNELN